MTFLDESQRQQRKNRHDKDVQMMEKINKRRALMNNVHK
jgi:hypothetical protein